MKYLTYIILGVATLLLLPSCGKQQEGKRLVKEFVHTNAVDPNDIDIISYGNLGTTKNISDSLLEQMRQRPNSVYRKGITYATSHNDSLFYLRMSYIHNGDTLQNTFYFDASLSSVVAFK